MRIEEYLIDQSNTSLSRKCPVNVLVVELREEGVEGREGVLRELRRGLLLRGELGQFRAQRRGPALRPPALRAFRALLRAGRPKCGRERRDVAHRQTQGGDLGELLAWHRRARDLGRRHRPAQGLEGPVYLPHATPLARVGRLPAVLAERLRLALGPRLARARGARTQLILVVIGHRMRAPRGDATPAHEYFLKNTFTPPTCPAPFTYTRNQNL